MQGFWADTRPNGQPVEPGTYCYVTDLEDGTHPIYTYGKTQEEVLNKLALQNANAQLALARKAASHSPSPPPLPVPPRAITPDEVMRATTDLDDPEKSGKAIATLVESATGVNLERLALQNFGRTAEEWEKEHAEFYSHPGNQRLLTQEALSLAGGQLGHITKEHLTRALHNLNIQGILLEDPSPRPAGQSPEEAPNTFPAETQVQREERPIRATRFATGSRSSGFQRQTAPTRTLKYSETEIRSMPLEKSRQLIAANDRDYAEACDFYFGSAARA